MRSRPIRLLIRAVVLGLLVTAGTTALASSAQAAAPPKISFSGIAFSAASADVSGGYAYIDLSWSVADTNPTATNLTGTVSLQEFDGGVAVGPTQDVTFGLPGDWPSIGPDAGTIANSHYTYEFLVRGFAASTNPVWRVTKISATDDAGTSKRTTGDLADLDVTGALIDTTGPELSFGIDGTQRNIVFDDGTGTVLHFFAQIADLETGFWKGRLVLTGPDNARITTPIELTSGPGGFLYCGHTPVDWIYDLTCDIDVPIPAGSPSGTWTPTSFAVTNNIGVTQRYIGFEPSAVRVTRNDVLSASDFTLTPSQVNNWRETQTITLSLRATGVHKGLSLVLVQSDPCSANTANPPIAADGTVTIPMTFMFVAFNNTCTVSGIALIDGAGNVAAYGSYYGGPPLDLYSSTIPDTTPPVALTAVVSPSTLVVGEPNHVVDIDVTIADDGLAPVTSYVVNVFDANGHVVGVGSGDPGGPDQDGVFHLRSEVTNLGPGTYTAGFSLTDKAGNVSWYGFPNIPPSQTPPSGPLILTVLPAS